MSDAKPQNRPKVLVAMSGGVDSSVAAALLEKQGCLVTGAYMKNFSPESWQGIVKQDCPWEEDLGDARTVCEKLGIKFRSFNFEKEYAERVIDYFFAEYAAGRTPNPDIICNKLIKFGLFLEKARELGFDFIATGHHARIRRLSLRATAKQSRRDRHGQRPRDDVKCELLKGVDPKKDQSYFLCQLDQNQLARTLFPIGEYTKAEVRQLARKFALPNAEKKDSQGLCFVGHIKLREFLKQRIPERAGEIVTTKGDVIGSHWGAAYYTIGQREGLGIGGGTPYYVVRKDVLQNRLTVTPRQFTGPVHQTQITVENVHWIGDGPSLPLRCTAKIRYQQPDQECTIRLCEEQSDEAIPRSKEIASRTFAMTKSKCLSVQFKTPQFAPAPGQAAVFYEGERVLGGGLIV